MSRATPERVLLGVLALAVWALTLGLLAVEYFLLIIVHPTNGGEYDDLVFKARVLGAVLLLPTAGLLWGAYALSRKAFSS